MGSLRDRASGHRVKSEPHRFARLGQWLLVAVVSLGAASDPLSRVNDLGHKLVCPCSCSELLLECNHVGCPDSAGMLAMLKTSVASGGSDETIFRAFQAKYGATVLAAPMLTRFNAVAWFIPPAILALGLLLSVALIRRWRQTRLEPAPAPSTLAPGARVREQIRRETEL